MKLPDGTTGANGRGEIRSSLSDDVARGRRAVSATCTRGGRESTGKAYVAIPISFSDGGNTALAIGLNVVLDLLLGGTLLMFVVLLVDMVVRATDTRERLMRSLALIGGAIIALGAEASGVSFADYTIDTLTGARPGGEVFKAFAAIVPGGIGAFFAWYFVRVMRRSADMGLRLMSFLGMLTVISFAVVFAEATSTNGVMLGAAAIPNASFVVGLIFGVVAFTPTADDATAGGGFTRFRDALRRRRSRRSAQFAPIEGDTSAPAPSATRNPFADD